MLCLLFAVCFVMGFIGGHIFSKWLRIRKLKQIERSEAALAAFLSRES